MRRLIFCLVSLTLALCASAHAGALRINGSSTVMGGILSKIKEPFEKSTGIELVLSANGSGAGARDLAAGKCDASVASESLEDLKKSVPELAAAGDVREHRLGKDALAVIVHKQNPVTRLSKEHLKGLNTGKIKNWKEVGGLDGDVIIVTSVKGSGTRSMFKKIIMDDDEYSPDIVEASTTMAEVKEVSSMKEAIGAVSESFVNDTVKRVEAPPIERHLLLVTKGEPSPAVKKLIDFILGEGQKYLKQVK